MDRVSEYIKAQREARGVTLEQLSKGTLISVAVLKDIEDGKFDKFKGDELYVKMYLKRIGEYLELDTGELVDDYVALTQEIQLQDIQKQEELLKLEAEEKKHNKRKKSVSSSLKDRKPTSTMASRKAKRVYEDNYIARYIKYGLVVLLCAVIVFVIWYSIVASKSNDNSSYTPPSSGNVETNPNASTDQKTEDSKKKEEEKEKKEEQPDALPNTGVTLTNVTASSFDVTGLKTGDTMKIEVTFKAQGNFNFWKGNSQVDGAYRVYNAQEVYTYESPVTIGDNYTFNFWNLSNAEIKVNGQVVNYDPTTVTVKNGVSYVKLYLKGE